MDNNNRYNNSPIAVFDSGIGGLTILKEIVALLPHEKIIYFADGANCPYGNKRKEEITAIVRNVIKQLIEEQVKLIVIACNTATISAVKTLRKEFDLPIVATEPAVKKAATDTKSGIIGVLATKATIESEQLALLCEQFGQKAVVLFQAGTGLVELVEKNEEESTEAYTLLRNYITPMLEHGMDQLVLGCTHYPFFQKPIQAIIGERAVMVVNPAAAIAKRTYNILKENELFASPESKGELIFHSSLDAAYDRMVESRFFQYIESV